nr:site-specific DNA-methyltransferase [Mycoplasma phocoeninasale]
MCKEILQNVKDEKDLQNVFQFLVKRVKTGFKFDIAPTTDSKSVVVLEYDEKKSFHNILKQNENENTLIIGENYDALKNLLVLERERERAGLEYNYDVIYIDPPYNTESAKSDGNAVADDKEKVKASKFIYRDKFSRNGWLNMMNERLIMARKLLKDDGVIFVSIDDTEQAYLKVLMDEIFGEENFYGQIIQLKGNTQNDSKTIQKNHEYILCYIKKFKPLVLKYSNIVKEKIYENQYILGRDMGASSGDDNLIQRVNLGYTIYYKNVEKITDQEKDILIKNANIVNKKYGSFNYFCNSNSFSHAIPIVDYNPKEVTDYSSEEKLYNNEEELINLGYIPIRPPKRKGNKLGRWTWSLKTFVDYWNANEVLIKNNKNVIKKVFISKNEIDNFSNENYYIKENILPLQSFVDIGNSNGTKLLKGHNGIIPGCNFENPKSIEIIKHLIKAYENKNARVLDFFAGSGTTGHAVLDLNREDGGSRSFTLVTNNENNIAEDVTYERLYRINNGKGSKGESFP